MHIIRDRIDKPLFSSIGFKKFNLNVNLDGLTTNNILICDSVETMQTVLFYLKKLDYNTFEVRVGLWQDELMKMSDLEFHKYLYEPKEYLDKLFVESQQDCITIQFRDYAIQKFYVTMTPEIINLSESINDIWFIGENAIALTEFIGHKEYWEDKKKLIQSARAGRFFI